ncbi:hypothetical protein Taro_037782 [Colocasia esculenta]|uniref:Anthocyanidin 5,3-O-glucosyltransferase n=1 Tax=Colocasia esculenta TaxID=4460 RepID=A0A843W514_COLES|nr:hypothetical protein [Colocasia esculenta]
MTAQGDGKGTIVLYPSPGMGHLVSMVELGKVFVRQGFPVTIAILDPPYNTGSTATFIDRVSKAHPSISFHRLPTVTLPDLDTPNHEALAIELIRLSNPNVLAYLKSADPLALVLDFFCASTVDVAAELGLPVFFFFTSGACSLAVFLHFPADHDAITESYKDLGDTPIHFPGVPPIPANHMATPVLDRRDSAYTGFLYMSKRLTEADGVIVNTFEEIEPAAVEAIREGLCVPRGVRTPPIYCIGPLITSEDQDTRERRAECLAWLDSQPRGSVVFLCFGSLGRFSAEQLKEIATGLEKSGQRFLWVVRSPPSDDPSKRFEKPPEPDLDALLPDGFLERTRERGMVVKSWAPQKSVLAHESVGGFVTHLGWNSVLEAIRAGVPMLGWPLYAEQRMNKVFMVDGLGLAGVMGGYDKELVSAAEVEVAVRWLMESEEGDALRMRTSAAREAAMAAQREGGSSHKALEELQASMAAPVLGKGTVVLYPSPGVGHLVSMVELGKVLARQGFSVTVVVVDPPYQTGSAAAFIHRVSQQTHQGIAFHRLPAVTLPHLDPGNQEVLIFELIRLSNPNLLLYLKSTSPLSLVLDFFCVSAMDVAAELGLPVFIFFTSGACSLAAFLHFPVIHDAGNESFKDLGDTLIHFPGIPPIPANHMPVPLLDRRDRAYTAFLSTAKRLTEVYGLIINTFEELEPEAAKAIRADLCTPRGIRTPPIYCVGPLITSEDQDAMDRGAECLAWLDSQPRASVVFLCFGSHGLFSALQLKEMATGLEKSGQRFLWVVRSPPTDDPSKRFEKPPEPDLDALLPAGFVQSTRERGKVVKSWAPQKTLLAHASVGGFVTHLGWNSALEAICSGVPMVAWPLYAEQRMNKVFMVDSLGLAGVMEGYDKELVTAAEVEASIRWLMESEEGQALRARASAAKEAAMAAQREDGSSYMAMKELVKAFDGE